jgi:hypothetical protein
MIQTVNLLLTVGAALPVRLYERRRRESSCCLPPSAATFAPFPPVHAVSEAVMLFRHLHPQRLLAEVRTVVSLIVSLLLLMRVLGAAVQLHLVLVASGAISPRWFR